MGKSVVILHPGLHPDVVLYPAPGSEFVPQTVLPASGHDVRVGAGAYTGSMLEVLGSHARYVGFVGNDVFGQYTIDELERLGHDVTLVRRYEGDTSVCMSVADDRSLGSTMVISFPLSSQRSFEDYLGVIEQAPRADAVYIWAWYWSFSDPALAGKPTSRLVDAASQLAPILLLDPNWKPAGSPPNGEVTELLRALPRLSILKLNRRDAQVLVGQHSPESTVRALLEFGPGVVALTLGAEGCLVGQRKGGVRVTHIPAAVCQVRDTTGAGDYFGGALLHALITGSDAIEAATFAAAASALAISRKRGEPLATLNQVRETLAPAAVPRDSQP